MLCAHVRYARMRAMCGLYLKSVYMSVWRVTYVCYIIFIIMHVCYVCVYVMYVMQVFVFGK